MSDVTGVSGGSGASSAEATGGGGSATSGTVDLNMTVSSAEELRTKAPKVWNAILQGVAMNICNQMKTKNDELKKMMRDSEKALRG